MFCCENSVHDLVSREVEEIELAAEFDGTLSFRECGEVVPESFAPETISGGGTRGPVVLTAVIPQEQVASRARESEGIVLVRHRLKAMISLEGPAA